MLGAVLGSNRAHIDLALEKIMGKERRRVGMVGLSFKKGTDDLRESPLVTIAERLIGKGYDLRIYDAEVNLSRLLGANKRYIEQSIPHIGSLMVDSMSAAIQFGDVVVVGAGGADVEQALRTGLKPAQEVVDLVGISSRDAIRGAYAGICW
jgi:GDP-mannose 6-dehydrogenase